MFTALFWITFTALFWITNSKECDSRSKGMTRATAQRVASASVRRMYATDVLVRRAAMRGVCVAVLRVMLSAVVLLITVGAYASPVYPLAPPGSSVTLELDSFIQSVPEQSSGLPDPNPVIGDNIGQHPGAFGVGFPPVGTYFIGVFGGPINTNQPGNAVYLWETSVASVSMTFHLPAQKFNWAGGMASHSRHLVSDEPPHTWVPAFWELIRSVAGRSPPALSP